MSPCLARTIRMVTNDVYLARLWLNKASGHLPALA